MEITALRSRRNYRLFTGIIIQQKKSAIMIILRNSFQSAEDLDLPVVHGNGQDLFLTMPIVFWLVGHL